MRALLRAIPTSLPRTGEVAVDPLVLLFTLGVSIATGLVFGLAPLMHTRVKGLVTALKEGGAKGATGAARHHVRRGLVIAEVALAVMLVIGAGLMLRTVFNLSSVDAGFDRARLVTFSIDAAERQLSAARRRARSSTSGCSTKLRGAARRAGRHRDVGAAAATGRRTPTTPTSTTTPRRRKARSRTSTTTRASMTGYFETMGIPIVDGRAFEPTDAASSGRWPSSTRRS